MNSVVMWSKHSLYNPFIYIAGIKSLLLGGIVLLLISFVSYISGTHYLGLVIPVFAKDTIFLYYLSEHLIHWFVLSILLFTSGSIFSKSRIRFIDILGTQALALFPLIAVPLVRLLPAFESFYIFSIYTFILYGLHVAMVIWCIALMFNARTGRRRQNAENGLHTNLPVCPTGSCPLTAPNTSGIGYISATELLLWCLSEGSALKAVLCSSVYCCLLQSVLSGRVFCQGTERGEGDRTGRMDCIQKGSTRGIRKC